MVKSRKMRVIEAMRRRVGSGKKERKNVHGMKEIKTFTKPDGRAKL
jgi:hypothetical protein